MGFEKDRKSYDTAHLGGAGHYYAESENQAVSAKAIAQAGDSPLSPLPLSQNSDYADQKIESVDL